MRPDRRSGLIESNPDHEIRIEEFGISNVYPYFLCRRSSMITGKIWLGVTSQDRSGNPGIVSDNEAEVSDETS